MGDLRRPFLIAALVLIALVVLIEIGSSLAVRADEASDEALRTAVEEQFASELAGLPAAQRELRIQQRVDQLKERRAREGSRPGLGIAYLALIDGLVLFTVILMGLGLFVPERVQGRVQGIVTLIVSIVVILLAIVLIIIALLLLILMLALLFSAPFGTIVYFAVYGFFDRGGAATTLGFLMLLKLAFAVCLVIAHQRFLQNRGLVLIVLTSLVAGIIVSFLHGFVPRPLVSITDAIAAIIVGIIAVIWAIVLLIGSLVSIFKSARLQA